MQSNDLLTTYDMFLYIQNSFNKYICNQIYGDELSDHLFEKWLQCDYNILKFISRLDNRNKELLLEWFCQQQN